MIFTHMLNHVLYAVRNRLVRDAFSLNLSQHLFGIVIHAGALSNLVQIVLPDNAHWIRYKNQSQ
jgi:hypothetical protein